jgi:uncharacterized protein (TIGR03437 family)
MLFGAEIGRRNAPTINIGGVVNAASYAPAPENFVSPNAIISIFGVDLALRTREVRRSDLDSRGRLPTSLGGVAVQINGLSVPLYFVSPLQINAQVPSLLLPGRLSIRVIRENLRSEPEAVELKPVAPGLFPVASHLDYSVVGRGEYPNSTPLRPGEVAIFWATGLGPTVPAVFDGELPGFIAWNVLPTKVWIGGRELPPHLLHYAGQAPGHAGLYQINVVLPEDVPTGDVEVQVEVDGVKSQPGFRVAVDPRTE